MNVRTLAAATVASLCFAACSEFDPVEDTSWNYSDEEESIINSFNENFVLRYGAIDPVHTWGFEELSAEPAEMKTRLTTDLNGNEWVANGYDIPLAITDAERNAVVHAFRTITSSNFELSEFKEFFAQQVYSGGNDYSKVNLGLTQNDYKYTPKQQNGGNPDPVLSSEKMNQLTFDTGHINNFNASDNKDWNGCTRVLDFKNTNIAYHNSYDGTYYNKKDVDYILLTVTWEEGGVTRSGSYLGFDFRSESQNGIIEKDNKFDDWIIKLTPADPNPGAVIPNPEQTNPVRVMCEDLGNTYDFDFNDLVFDVYFIKSSTDAKAIKAVITVQAAGGTMPIYIGSEITSEREAHHLLGASITSKAINVGAGQTRTPRKFVIPATSTNADDIEIYVGGVSNKATVTILPKSSTTSNRAPQKIATDQNTRWLKENQQIEWGYPDFAKWVNDRNVVWINNKQESYLY
ncbi:MAG: hypothetical protein Q4A50_06595 [Bacteroidales bacterium]|nr:hypothetical protein [Bacteroidales bacterium]